MTPSRASTFMFGVSISGLFQPTSFQPETDTERRTWSESNSEAEAESGFGPGEAQLPSWERWNESSLEKVHLDRREMTSIYIPPGSASDSAVLQATTGFEIKLMCLHSV